MVAAKSGACLNGWNCLSPRTVQQHSVCVQVNINPWVLLSNAAAAFGLNLSVFLLIGKTSALTMNVAGVIKDWLLIGLSVLIFQAQVRRL